MGHGPGPVGGKKSLEALHGRGRPAPALHRAFQGVSKGGIGVEHQGFDQSVPVFVIPVKRRGRHAHAPGNSLDGQPLDALLGNDFQGKGIDFIQGHLPDFFTPCHGLPPFLFRTL